MAVNMDSSVDALSNAAEGQAQAQVKLLHAGLPASIGANLLLSLILLAILNGVVAPELLVAWWLVFALVQGWRWLDARGWQARFAQTSAQVCLARFRLRTITSGLAWGAGSVVLFPPGEVAYQALIAFTLAGVCASAATTLAVDRRTVIGFIVSTILPINIMLLGEQGAIPVAMGLMGTLFLGVIALGAQRNGILLHENIRLRLDAARHAEALEQSAAALQREQDRTVDLNRMLHTVLDTIPVGLYWKDGAGRYLGCNRQFSNDAGAEGPRQVVGKMPDALPHHALADVLQAGDDEVLSGGSGRLNVEQALVEAEQAPRWLRVSRVPLRNGNGQLMGLLGLYDDFTEERRISDELVAAKVAAESASRAKSEFLSSMSHELRTPLNAILGFSYLLNSDPALDHEAREHAGEIERAGKLLLSLISDLMDLSRIESGNLDIHMARVPVAGVVDECMAIMRPQAESNRLLLKVDMGNAADATVRADPKRLRQVLLNLLSNAVKYNRPGGTVALSLVLGDERLVFRVQDTGFGIPADKQSRLFHAFDRLGAECGTVEGTGIGLVLSRRMMLAMEGEIGFESVDGEGSTFWLSCPLDKADAPVRAVEPAVALGKQRRSRPGGGACDVAGADPAGYEPARYERSAGARSTARRPAHRCHPGGSCLGPCHEG